MNGFDDRYPDPAERERLEREMEERMDDDDFILDVLEDAVGRAQCGCVYHAEQGIPCQHDGEYRAGYAAGRAGKPCPEDASRHFRAGWARGDSAADESSNSHRSWGA